MLYKFENNNPTDLYNVSGDFTQIRLISENAPNAAGISTIIDKDNTTTPFASGISLRDDMTFDITLNENPTSYLDFTIKKHRTNVIFTD